MARYFAVTIIFDGRLCKGDWALLHGGRLHVRAPGWGVDTVEIGLDEPVSAAQAAMRKIVEGYYRAQADERERQARELARLSKPRRTRRPPQNEEGQSAR